MKILMVYPKYPDTFWSLKHIIKLFGKKASLPPLGLMTVSSILPKEFEKKLIDMNITELTDNDLLWADFVFGAGGMTLYEIVFAKRPSVIIPVVKHQLERCKHFSKRGIIFCENFRKVKKDNIKKILKSNWKIKKQHLKLKLKVEKIIDFLDNNI